MSPDEAQQTSKSAKDNNINNQQQQGSGGRKTSSSTSSSTKPQEQNMKCPRCDSPNTKFCYYNNYSLTQPRHFCKTCRRYWTKGGALRNVPIGGGCRKNKRVKSSSRLSCDSKDSATSSEFVGGLKFLHSLSSPSMDFHLGNGNGNGLPFPRLQLQHHPPLFNHFPSYGETSSAMSYSATSNSLAAMNYPFPTGNNSNYNGAIQGLSSMNINHGNNNNIASSIESLSSMNQDLHWKLQQQRLSMLFGGENQKDNNNQTEKPLQPILFQNLEVSKPAGGNFCVGNSRREGVNGGGDTPTEWFFGNSYGSVAATPTASGGAGHDNGNNWNGGGVHAWNDVQQQYSAMP